MPQFGYTALMKAADNGHTECLSVLLNSGAAAGDKNNVCKIEHNIYMMYVYIYYI